MSMTERELSMAQKVAYKVGSRWSAVEVEDLASELTLWLFEHEAVVAKYRGEEHGEAKLFVALRRKASKYCAREQAARTGGPLMDEGYTVAQVERALPFIFEDTPQSVYDTVGDFAPAYRGTHSQALEILTDLRGAFHDMPDTVKETLCLRFRDGMSYAEMGQLTGVTLQAAQQRVQRAVRRVRDHLSAPDVGEVSVREV